MEVNHTCDIRGQRLVIEHCPDDAARAGSDRRIELQQNGFEEFLNPQYTESHQTTQTNLCAQFHLSLP